MNRYGRVLLHLATAIPASSQVAHAQVIELRVTDTTGKPIRGAVVEVLSHTSTTPLVIDTVKAPNGEIRVRAPAFSTKYKFYITKVCGPHFAPQFIGAPFAEKDVLRAMVALSPSSDSGGTIKGACDAKADDFRGKVADTSTFVAQAAASYVDGSMAQSKYAELHDNRSGGDAARPVLYLSHTWKSLNQRLTKARSESSRERAAHGLLSFALLDSQST